MYYSASTVYDPSKHCIGAAVATSVLGPYIPYMDPMICPLARGGAIDPAGYIDQGQRYVVYKTDGNAIGGGGLCRNSEPPVAPTPIMLQYMAEDGVTLQSGPVQLLDHNGTADANTIEGPSLVRAGSHYVLFFSSGCFKTTGYTVNYATAPSIAGPYQRAARPLFVTGDYGLTAPGGMSIDGDGKHMLFHADFGVGRALYSAIVDAGGFGV